MPPPDGFYTSGVDRIAAQWPAGQLLVEFYYNPAGGDPFERDGQPIVNVSGRLENGNTGNRALRVFNSSPDSVRVGITDNTTGEHGRVTVPGGGDMVDPVFTRTAAQLAALDITTIADLVYSITV